MKGFKTVLFGALVATVPTAVTYLGGVDWTSLGISPAVSGLIGMGIIGLRAITNTSLGKSA